MYPFSFIEFLRGTGKKAIAEYLENLNIIETENLAHGQLLEAYKEFLLVGGMPEAVTEYAETGSLLKCRAVHRDIITNFKDDFSKYGSSLPTDVLIKVFDYAMHNICRQTKATSAIPGVTAYQFDESIKLLGRAGLIHTVSAVPGDTFPFGATEKNANKKLIVFDTGVYLTECGLDTASILTAEVFDAINKGDVVEMQTGLEMIKYSDSGENKRLFYWYRSGANAEVDYVISSGTQAIPIEVKASQKGGMQSIHSFLQTHDNAPFGIRVSMENFGTYESIKVVPAYGISRLPEILNSPSE